MGDLFKFGESQGVAIFGTELHESHVRRMSELCDDAETGKQPIRGQRCQVLIWHQLMLENQSVEMYLNMVWTFTMVLASAM